MYFTASSPSDKEIEEAGKSRFFRTVAITELRAILGEDVFSRAFVQTFVSSARVSVWLAVPLSVG
jgi:hypothetical protein